MCADERKFEELILYVAQESQDDRNLNATEVSDLSHRFVGWQVVDVGEETPYDTVFVDEPRPLTDEEVAWAHEVIEEYLGRSCSPVPSSSF